ncbi:hypothetical protein EKQ44_07235 [Sutcliffiella horikoshii]|nr:hypothetical protein [Sutcliffiella horikoshii]
MALTDSAGNIAATYEYDEWGNVTRHQHPAQPELQVVP